MWAPTRPRPLRYDALMAMTLKILWSLAILSSFRGGSPGTAPGGTEPTVSSHPVQFELAFTAIERDSVDPLRQLFYPNRSSDSEVEEDTDDDSKSIYPAWAPKTTSDDLAVIARYVERCQLLHDCARSTLGSPILRC